MITTQERTRLVTEFARTGSVSMSAIKSGMDRKTARKYLQNPERLRARLKMAGADVRRTPPTEMLARRRRESVEVRNAGFPTGDSIRLESRR